MKKIAVFISLGLLVVVGLMVRLYKIENPIADWHSWRQADTSAVTRNFVKHGINLMYPKYDDFSDVSGNGLWNPEGNRFVEFPIFNLLHYILFTIGPTATLEEYGRLTSSLAAITSGVLLFFLIRRHHSESAGLMAAALYLFIPFNIFFTRVVLPDPLMVTLFLATLNLYDIYASKRSIVFFFLTAVFGAMAVLVKPIAIFFLLPISLSMFVKYRLDILKRWDFYLLHGLFILPFTLWRVWSHRHPEGIPASTWLLNGNKIRFKPSFFQWIFGHRLGVLILGKWGIWPLLTGVIKSNWYILSLAASSLLYVSVFATGNVQHDYYQIPIIPSVAALTSVGAIELWRSQVRTWLNRGLVVMCIGFMFFFSWQEIKGLYQVNNWSIVHAGQAADKLLPKDAKVIAPYMGDTAFLYQTNRPGFAFLYDPIKDLIDRYGINYYVSVNYDTRTREIMEKYTVIEQTPEYVIVKLEEKLH